MIDCRARTSTARRSGAVAIILLALTTTTTAGWLDDFGVGSATARELQTGVGVDSRINLPFRPTKDATGVVPMAMIDPKFREPIAEVIREAQFHRRGAPDSFPCGSDLYLLLVNQPVLTLGLWQELADTSAWLRQIGPSKFEGSDGGGASAVWEYVYRSPQLHVLLCNLNYVGPKHHVKLDGRVVLVVRSEYYKDRKSAPWVKHDVEIFAKVDSKVWKTIAKAARPLIEKLMEDQVEEAGWFVSIMARLIAQHPNWALGGVAKRDNIAPDVKERFRALVEQLRSTNNANTRPSITSATTNSSKPTIPPQSPPQPRTTQPTRLSVPPVRTPSR